MAEILHLSDIPTVTAPISNTANSAQSHPISLLRGTAIRALFLAALSLTTGLPLQSADNRSAASLRIHVNVVSMINSGEPAQKPGDMQLPTTSEVRVMNNSRSEWFPQRAAGSASTELITTVIVPR